MISLSSRRYIGSKAKLANWIMGNMMSHTHGGIFCDLFAGTGVIAKEATHFYKSIIINDILLSNYIIYNAFFGEGDLDESKIILMLDRYNRINPNSLPDNYFSRNFGNKYFDPDSAKKIGYIREEIEYDNNISLREYYILLTALIYGMDRIANTVGHFDAYIRKPIPPKTLTLLFPDLVKHGNVKVLKEDANLVAAQIQADIVYIDPPYNSRQYSRFYHIYENLVKWDKPNLYGIALKPKPEGMSKYCTNKATSSFNDLIMQLNVPFIAVSYNNTYNSKSSSSRNKISLDDLQSILAKKGDVYKYETNYSPFSAGKTNFTDHKEYLFIVRTNL